MAQEKKSPRATVPGKPSNVFRANPFEVDPRRERRDSLSALDRMLQAEDLSVVFQPIVDVATFRVFAYEALVRCRVPELSNPAVLFERAVEEGCVGRLGRMVREVAVPLCAGRPLFLNVHPAELQGHWLVRPDDPMFFHDEDVYVEITESVPFSHFDLCRDVLREVRSRGSLHLVVDDLGAGYSNLKRIADLEPRVVKLDRSLIASVTEGSRQQRLVANVVRLCEDMGARVVAEGIETVAEWKALRDTGVHYAQGYLFARPSFPLPGVTVPAEVEFRPRNTRTPVSLTAPSRDTRTPVPCSVPPRDTRTPVPHQALSRDTRTPVPHPAPPRDTRTPVPLQPAVPHAVAPPRDTRTPVSLGPLLAPAAVPPYRDGRGSLPPVTVTERDVRPPAVAARDSRTPTSMTLHGIAPAASQPLVALGDPPRRKP